MYSKKFFKTTLFLGLLMSGTTAFAGSCGSGKIVRVNEGGWNSADLFIKIDYSVSTSTHSGTEHQGWIRYRSTALDAELLRSIRSMAYLAFASGQSIETWSHGSVCNSATDMTMF